MRVTSLFVTVLLISLVYIGLCEGKKKPQKGWCDANTNTRHLSVEDMRSGVPIKCKKGKVADVALLGHNGSCAGLSSHLFVQALSCQWKSSCKLRDDPPSTLMLKVYEGKPTDCIFKTPDTFTLTHYCTKKKVPVLVMGEGETPEKPPKKGVVLSHGHHPWFYRRSQPLTTTLKCPRSKDCYFYYTFRSLQLFTGDYLTLTADDEEKWTTLTSAVVSNFVEAQTVQFTFTTTHYTNGQEGFVLCFQWSKTEKRKPPDSCKKLIVQEKCENKEKKDQTTSEKRRARQNKKPRNRQKKKSLD